MAGGTPKLLHAYWDPDGPPMPSDLAGYLDKWRALHSSWSLVLWTDDMLPPLCNQELFDPARWSPRSSPSQYKADLVRYELLYQIGGVWVDCDMEPLRPIDDLIESAGGRLVVGWESQDRWLNNAFLAAPHRHPALELILAGLGDSVRRKPWERCNVTTGARYITPLLRDRDDVLLLDQRLVYPYRWDRLDLAGEEFPDAWMIHRWHRALTRRRRRAS